MQTNNEEQRLVKMLQSFELSLTALDHAEHSHGVGTPAAKANAPRPS